MEGKRLVNCHFSPEQNKKFERIQAVASKAIEKMPYEQIAKELDMEIEEVRSTLNELLTINPLAYHQILAIRDETTT